MFGSLFDLLAKVFGDFSWRRLFGLAGLLAALALGLSAFELYTSNFRLSRLERATAVLERLNSLAKDTSGQSTEIAALRHQLERELSDALSTSSRLAALRQSAAAFRVSRGFAVYVAGAAPFLLLALVFFLGSGSTRREDALAWLGAGFFGLVIGWLGVLIPIRAGWFNFGVFPLGAFLFVMLLVYLYSKRPQLRSDAA